MPQSRRRYASNTYPRAIDSSLGVFTPRAVLSTTKDLIQLYTSLGILSIEIFEVISVTADDQSSNLSWSIVLSRQRQQRCLWLYMGYGRYTTIPHARASFNAGCVGRWVRVFHHMCIVIEIERTILLRIVTSLVIVWTTLAVRKARRAAIVVLSNSHYSAFYFSPAPRRESGPCLWLGELLGQIDI